MNITSIIIAILTLTAGIGVFLVACQTMSNNLESAGSRKLRRLFARRATTNGSAWASASQARPPSRAAAR